MPRLRLSIPESISTHKHKIAVTAASCTAVTGAIIGALAAGASGANAATAPVAHVVHIPVLAPTLPASPSASASATPSAAPTSAKPSAPATTKAAAPATTKPAPVVQKVVDPYAGLSAYQIAERIVPSGEFGCFDWIVTRESGWDVHATNPSSGAYGLGQALPGYKMASEGSDWRDNPVTQIKWTLNYMDERYGSPCSAQSFWEAHNWY